MGIIERLTRGVQVDPLEMSDVDRAAYARFLLERTDMNKPPPHPAFVAEHVDVSNADDFPKTQINDDILQEAAEAQNYSTRAPRTDEAQLDAQEKDTLRTGQKPPIDWSKPVRMRQTNEPVEVIATRARGDRPILAYVGNRDYFSLFTLSGYCVELDSWAEQAPETRTVYLNVWPKSEPHGGEPFIIVQYETEQLARTCGVGALLSGIPLEVPLP